MVLLLLSAQVLTVPTVPDCTDHADSPRVNLIAPNIRLLCDALQVVLATNIAETSLTIDDVVYVVDTGRVKEKTYDESTGVGRWIFLHFHFKRVDPPSEMPETQSTLSISWTIPLSSRLHF
jgi:hypothetical protein